MGGSSTAFYREERSQQTGHCVTCNTNLKKEKEIKKRGLMTKCISKIDPHATTERAARAEGMQMRQRKKKS
jgi:hypothetical protein